MQPAHFDSWNRRRKKVKDWDSLTRISNRVHQIAIKRAGYGGNNSATNGNSYAKLKRA